MNALCAASDLAKRLPTAEATVATVSSSWSCSWTRISPVRTVRESSALSLASVPSSIRLLLDASSFMSSQFFDGLRETFLGFGASGAALGGSSNYMEHQIPFVGILSNISSQNLGSSFVGI
ncbi:hypothetical protein ZIOFF_034157 [Zingiber officinale]|uniref:Uncharacterized protein n=1 Tax=Zingiber officinale TaxID=94328 RepID=A0A8J5LCR8_ZINOF|nr:hypothetical protein ZIOFF_034157 [Zingiber officinale]